MSPSPTSARPNDGCGRAAALGRAAGVEDLEAVLRPRAGADVRVAEDDGVAVREPRAHPGQPAAAPDRHHGSSPIRAPCQLRRRRARAVERRNSALSTLPWTACSRGLQRLDLARTRERSLKSPACSTSVGRSRSPRRRHRGSRRLPTGHMGVGDDREPHRRGPPRRANSPSAIAGCRAVRAASRPAAAWRPWSRLPPPARASACSRVSQVITPKAQGTPVASWVFWIPAAASPQTKS